MTTDSTAQEALELAIAGLYAAFEAPLAPGFAERCTALSSRKNIARKLERTPREDAGAEELAAYSLEAGGAKADEPDFKHFLPRLLELYATDAEWHDHESQLFPKLAGLRWTTWPAGERKAIQDYLGALWRAVRESGEAPVTPADVLRAMADMGADLAPVLAGWHPTDAERDLIAAGELAVSYLVATDDFGAGGAEIDRWLSREKLQERLEKAFFAHAGQPTGDLFEQAAELLRDRKP